MSKLVVMIIVTVLIVGAALYAIGGQIIPATTTSGDTQKTNIINAFQ